MAQNRLFNIRSNEIWKVENLEWCDNKYNTKYSAKPLTPEHRQKIGNANRGKKRTEEQRQQMSLTAKKYYETPGAKEKLSRAVKLSWESRKNG